MTRLARIRAMQCGVSDIECDLEIPAGLDYFQGHFPGVPLLPGVVQIDWAIGLARQHFKLRSRFRGFSRIKFARVIQPGAVLRLSLRCDEGGGELMFRFHDDAGEYSSGHVLFADD